MGPKILCCAALAFVGLVGVTLAGAAPEAPAPAASCHGRKVAAAPAGCHGGQAVAAPAGCHGGQAVASNGCHGGGWRSARAAALESRAERIEARADRRHSRQDARRSCHGVAVVVACPADCTCAGCAE